MDTILIVGASGQIGQMLAESLIKKGRKVIGISRTGGDYTFEHHTVDITKREQVESFYKTLDARNITLDGLVAIVGTTSPPKKSQANTPELQDISNFETIMDVNLISLYRLIHMLKNQFSEGSSIVTFSSIGAALGFPGNPAYQCSKAAIEALSRSLAYDLRNYGIRCNSLRLGYIKSGMTLESYSDEKRRLDRASRTLMDRWGEISEVIGPVLFLLSSESSYMTGSVITVDGGWSAKGM